MKDSKLETIDEAPELELEPGKSILKSRRRKQGNIEDTGKSERSGKDAAQAKESGSPKGYEKVNNSAPFAVYREWGAVIYSSCPLRGKRRFVSS